MALWLPSVFSDHMVVQQGRPVQVWGRAEINARVRVTFAESICEVEANDNGEWRVQLPPVPAGGPYEFAVHSGEERRVIRNVACGEVWFCSGQSNMVMPTKGIEAGQRHLEQASVPGLRLFRTGIASSEHPLEDVRGSWAVCDAASASDFSGIGFLYGLHLHARLDVPVGVIVSAVGATAIQSWMSREAFEANPPLRQDFEEANATEKEAQNQPCALYNGMVAGLQPYAIKGVLWYQGERNANVYNPSRYGGLLEALIADVRRGFEQPTLPFHFVQLPSYEAGPAKDWVRLRQEQALVAKRVSDTAMAVAIDLGERKDIHPARKAEIAERLYRIAMDEVYGQDPFCGFPEFREMVIQENKVGLTFDRVADGLTSSDPDDVQGFEVRGSDGSVKPVRARITGRHQVELEAPFPLHEVRYAWHNWNGPGLLHNSEGYPAAPFCIQVEGA